MQNFILMLLYANDVVLFSYDVDSMQHLLGVLEEFCHSSGLVVNVEKTKNDDNANHQTSSLPYAHI